MTTVYSFIMKFEGEKVIEIDRDAEEVSIPPTATRICEVACFFGSICSLDLENTQITIIEKHAFANCYNLEEIRFPSCLKEICEGVFKQCRNLESVSFPTNSRLLKISRNAFKCCEKLKEIDFPPLLEFIGDNAFGECDKMKTFDLRKTRVRHIGEYALGCKDSMAYFPPTAEVLSIIGNCFNHVVIDSHPVTKKDECGYFNACGRIFGGMHRTGRHVLIRRGVEQIAKNCFYSSSLVSVTIPSSVTEISESAFFCCNSLRFVHFSKNSRLKIIQRGAFSFTSLLNIRFPNSLTIIKEGAFSFCRSLERVIFLHDSHLERIEGAFVGSSIKRLSLPPSVREITDVSYGMEKLESMFVSNEYYQSNEEGSAIFSKDGSELVCVVKKLTQFEIPDSVCLIKKGAFHESSITSLIVPPSVEVIDEEAFKYCFNLENIEFEEGSRLKSLAFNAFDKLESLIINNENFVKMENGVVMSLNPMGIVFVPKYLTELEIPPGVEVIFSYAFYESKIKNLNLPKSLKKIFHEAFDHSSLESVTFEEGTKLDFIGHCAFSFKVKSLKLPSINGDLESYSLNYRLDVIEFPPKLNLKNKNIMIFAAKISCPSSIISTLAHFEFGEDTKLFIEDDD